MKAEDIFGNKDGQTGELAHKLRTVTDLIRHIKTKEESSPANYSIFLGAGASVTSGIRTAGQLTDEWANELYERFKRVKSQDANQAKGYFEKEHPSWYNADNPYSSLFEKKFDLPTQRRRFVEQEVDGKLPSIGYSYLVSLVDYNYFNTIFTTNFDDLINEAFYVFSNKRPIVCAHDSSIRSVSITSKRPKIVKLHGDYLFDDIKSTLRETESLEQNTKEKFVEFCKEYGLIVVGYSGRDRSIMDVIEFLVKQENYLKNGIYWCLRPGDEVCHNLRNLIWKDKVYPVLIDGFDELFAAIHSNTIGKELSLNSSTKQSKLEMTIRQIVEDSYGLAKNELIEREILSIREDGDSKDISSFIKQLSQTNESSRLGVKDLRNLLEIQSLTENLELVSALEICSLRYSSAGNTIEKKIYIEQLIHIHIKSGDEKKVTYWCDKLIELDPNNIGYHLKKAVSIKKLPERDRFYRDLVLKYPYSTAIRNNAAGTLIRIMMQAGSADENLSQLAKEHLDKSLSVDPGLNNLAWDKTMDLLSFLFHHSKDAEEKKRIKDDAAELVKSARMRHPEHRKTIELLESQLSFGCKKSELSGLLDLFFGLMSKSSLSKRGDIVVVVAKAFEHVYEIDDNKELKEKVRTFFQSYVPEPHQHVKVSLAKIRYLFSIEKDEVLARKDLELLLARKNIGMYVGDILDLPLEFSPEEIAIIKLKLEADRNELINSYYHEALSEIYTLEENYELASQNIEQAYSEGGSFENYLTKRTYLLLKTEDYRTIIALASQHAEKLKDIESEAFVINLQLAAKKLSHPIFNEVTLRNLAGLSDSDEVKLCAFSILDQHVDAKRLMKKLLEKDPGLIKKYRDWPAVTAECFPEEVINKSQVA